MSASKGGGPKALVDKRAAAEEFGLSLWIQEELTRQGKFCSALRIGKKIYYLRAELEAWLDSQRIVTTHEGIETALSGDHATQ